MKNGFIKVKYGRTADIQKQSSRGIQKKRCPSNFAKFTEKHLCQSIFINKVAGLKKRPWHRCFHVNFVKFLRTPFIEHFWWLLLDITFNDPKT